MTIQSGSHFPESLAIQHGASASLVTERQAVKINEQEFITQERRRLNEGDIAGLKVSVERPSNMGEVLLNRAVGFLKQYQDNNCKFDVEGLTAISRALFTFKDAFENHGIRQAKGPINTIETINRGLGQRVKLESVDLMEYLDGGHRSSLIRATDTLKAKTVNGEMNSLLPYKTCTALLRINNIH